MKALLQRDLSGKSLLVVALLLFGIGFFTDPPWKRYGLPNQHFVFENESGHVAQSLYLSGTFSDPFDIHTGPTAHVAPVFPYLQFLIVKVFGVGAGGWVALRCLATLALSLVYGLLPYAARLFGYNAWTGVLASVLGLIVKPVREEHSESHLAALAGLLLTAAVWRWVVRRTAVRATVAGLLAGFAALIQPVIALVYAGWLAYFAWRTYRAQSHARPGALLASSWPLLAVPVLVCAPWAIRNHFALGGSYGVRDNLGIELYVSYDDCAPYSFYENFYSGCFGGHHPSISLAEARAVRDMGEYHYNQDRMRTALTWATHHPRQTAILAVERFWFFWFPSRTGEAGYLRENKRAFFFHLMTLASFVGFYLSWKHRMQASVVLALWMVLFPLIYYVVQFDPRYRLPIFWLTWLGSAYAFMCIWKWFSPEASASRRTI